ncbi:bifunctional phosphoglucose/phosphomannose isomerase [Candidatus Woesearchaeota archaeon]|nr:bifunctional phosphoglucose/phosphomannose isomerase [Candidatus Woesearchaeota archaeon]
MSEEPVVEGQEEKQKVFPDEYWQYDREGAYRTIKAMPDHIRAGYRLGEGVRPARSFSRVVVAGMGGSGIAGDLLKELVDYDNDTKVVVETAKGYDAPKTVDGDTLLIAVSYSGNTEETLSTYKTAARKGCQVLLVSSGGKLEELAKVNRHQHLKLPKDLQPRMAVAYLFFPLLRVLENAGVVKSYAQEVDELAAALRRQDVSAKAAELSGKCYGKTPLIYADQSFYPVAYRWKTQFNENAKTTSFCHAFSEMNHNELLSFENRAGAYHAFFLSTDKEHRRVAKRIALAKDVLQQKGVSVTEINIKGPLLKQVFTTIYLGDLTSFFLALRYGTDPTPVELIERFKRDLGPFLI